MLLSAVGIVSFALIVGFVFRLESIKMECLLSFVNGDIYLLDSGRLYSVVNNPCCPRIFW